MRRPLRAKHHRVVSHRRPQPAIPSTRFTGARKTTAVSWLHAFTLGQYQHRYQHPHLAPGKRPGTAGAPARAHAGSAPGHAAADLRDVKISNAHHQKLSTEFPTRDKMARHLGGLPEMLIDFSWRNVAVFLVALMVTSCLMLGGVIIAVDRLLYTSADEQSALVERPRHSSRDSQFRTPRLSKNHE